MQLSKRYWSEQVTLQRRHLKMPPQRILLTGANGFVGSHVLDQLLTHGHSVRAIVRSESKASQVLADFPNYGSRLDFGIVPDITSPGAFDKVVVSAPPFDIAIHTASPFLCKYITHKSLI